jgi:hypothetical protein
MSSKLLIASFLLLVTCNSYSQDFDITKKKLTTIRIDTVTEKVFIYKLQTVNIYFKQQDIIDFILNPKNKNLIGQGSYKDLLDTLNTSTRVITVTNIPDHKNEAEFDSLLRIYGDSIKLQNLNTQFYFVGAALMLNGDFMIFSKEHRNFLTKGLFAVTHKGLLGERSLDFYIPKKQRYYFIITRLGE